MIEYFMMAVSGSPNATRLLADITVIMSILANCDKCLWRFNGGQGRELDRVVIKSEIHRFQIIILVRTSALPLSNQDDCK